MIQLAWRFLLFQKESALALWYRARTADSRIGTRRTSSAPPIAGKLNTSQNRSIQKLRLS